MAEEKQKLDISFVGNNFSMMLLADIFWEYSELVKDFRGPI
jgi:hypothetical protein